MTVISSWWWSYLLLLLLLRVQIECSPHVFYGCTDSAEERQKVRRRQRHTPPMIASLPPAIIITVDTSTTRPPASLPPPPPSSIAQLLIAVDMARRVKITGDNGDALVKFEDATVIVSAAEPGRKVFSWGVGNLLGNGDAKAQAWALPQRVTGLKPPIHPTAVIAGPEHAACVDSDGNVHLWGSNEFTQTGASGT